MNLEHYVKIKASSLKNVFNVLFFVTVAVFVFIGLFYKDGNQFTPESTPTQQQLEDDQNQQMMIALIILST